MAFCEPIFAWALSIKFLLNLLLFLLVKNQNESSLDAHWFLYSIGDPDIGWSQLIAIFGLKKLLDGGRLEACLMA